jgi:hypothetical protein
MIPHAMTRRFAVPALRIFAAGFTLLAVTALLAACGSSSNSSTNPSSPHYDPAKTTLHKAGLAVCSEQQHGAPPQVTSMPGLGITRSFFVAKDCKGAKVTPNSITVFQFTNLNDFTTGTAKIKTALPNASVAQHYPLVIAATGPDKEANLAAVVKQLPPTAVNTTTT